MNEDAEKVQKLKQLLETVLEKLEDTSRTLRGETV